MIIKLAGSMAAILVLSACASVPMVNTAASSQAKVFRAPTPGTAGLYIYRSSIAGSALKKDLWVDQRCIGESAPNVFFYTEVAGDQEHTISTESEFSPNSLKMMMQSNKVYFVEQYIKMGLFVGGANVKVVDPVEGEKKVRALEMAVGGTCSS